MSGISPTMTTSAYEQAQAITLELLELSGKIEAQLSTPSMEQFGSLYQSYERAVDRAVALSKIESVEAAFQDALQDHDTICDTIASNCAAICDKLAKGIELDAQSLSTTPQEELAKKCDELFQRIQTFKKIEPRFGDNPLIKSAFETINQMQQKPTHPSHRKQDQDCADQYPPKEECIKTLPSITNELLDLLITLNATEENSSRLEYFKPIALAYKDTAEREKNT